MSNFVNATLRAAETVRSLGGESGNPLMALMAYFEPILQDMNGQIYQPTVFSDQVRSAYGWDFNSEAAEGFRNALRKLGYLRISKDANGNPLFSDNNIPVDLICANAATDGNEEAFGKTVDHIVISFRSFLDTIGLSQSHAVMGDDEIIKLIIQEVLTSFQNELPEIAAEVGDEEKKHDRERYLVARFVRHVLDSEDKISDELALIYSVGLIAELADDFRTPLGRIKRASVTFFLDSPVALDLLGTSGLAVAETTRSVIEKLQKLGCKIEIFDATRQELINTLYAVVNAAPNERTGVTAEALMNADIEEQYIWSVIRDPAGAFRTHNVAVRPRIMDNNISSDVHFSSSLYDKLYNQYLFPYSDIKNPETRKKYEKRCQHDTNAVALVTRLRGDDAHSDIFESRFLFLTRNGLFARIAKSFSVDEGLIDDSCIGPFVTMHELAASLWLRTGMQDSVIIPKKQLLTSCARVLARNEKVIGNAKRAILTLRKSEVDVERARRLEAILMQNRSMLMISDLVRGAMKSFSVDDIQGIVDEYSAQEIKKGIALGAKEVALEYEALKEENRGLLENNRDLAESLRLAEEERNLSETEQKKKFSDLAERLDSIDRRDEKKYVGVVEEVSIELGKRRIRIALSVVTLIIALVLFSSINQVWDYLSLGPAQFGSYSVTIRQICIASGIFIGGLYLVIELVLRLFGLDSVFDKWLFEKWANRRIIEKAKAKDVFALFQQYPPRYENKTITIDLQ